MFKHIDKPTEVFNYITMVVIIGFLVFILILLAVLLFARKKVRDITIVNKRVTKRKLLNDPKTNTGYQRSSTYEHTNLSVDFIYAGKKMVHTLFCDKDLYKKFISGHTYRVAIRYPNILYIISKNNMDK